MRQHGAWYVSAGAWPGQEEVGCDLALAEQHLDVSWASAGQLACSWAASL